MNSHLEKLQAKMKKATVNFKRAVAEEQKVCKHETLEECSYIPLFYVSSLPPLRVCCDCGMTEEGWGTGYIILKGKAKMVSRDEIYLKRVGTFIDDKTKGPLLRKELTIQQVIEQKFLADNK